MGRNVPIHRATISENDVNTPSATGDAGDSCPHCFDESARFFVRVGRVNIHILVGGDVADFGEDHRIDLVPLHFSLTLAYRPVFID